MYVQESVYEKFIEALKTKAEQCSIGQPSDEKTSFGPLISEGQRDKVLGYIESGKEEGARLVTGGQKWKHAGEGYWLEPTILADVKSDMKVVQEEVRLRIQCVSDPSLPLDFRTRRQCRQIHYGGGSSSPSQWYDIWSCRCCSHFRRETSHSSDGQVGRWKRMV